ncbi:MAG: chemotaxis protein CheA [Prolixibacteraceae bacterium]
MIEKFQQRFVEEARDNCDRLEQHLMELEHDFTNQNGINEVFRIMHSLKGSGGMFGFGMLSEFTHELESLYELIREGKLLLNSTIISFTLRAVDVLRSLLSPVIPDDVKRLVIQYKAESKLLLSGGAGVDAVQESSAKTIKMAAEEKKQHTWYLYFKPNGHILNNGTNPLYLLDELNTLGECLVEADLSEIPLPGQLLTDNCYTAWRAVLTTAAGRNEIEDVFLFVQEQSRIDLIELPDLQLPAKEELLRRFSAEEPEAVIRQLKSGKAAPAETAVKMVKNLAEDASLSTIRVESARVDEYMNLVSEMIIAQSRLYSVALARKDKEIEALAERFDRLTHQFRENAFDMSLIPLYHIVTRFRRLIRDLSAELNKEINLSLSGLETEIDKNVIEKLVNPMIHIIRNCVDHGIELPADRISKGKPVAGTVSISAGYEGNSIEINIRDDGKGLDLERIRKKAQERGLLREDEYKTDEELIQFIFKPGFTTSEHLSDVSGRGIGLDAARKIIHDLRGEITVSTERGWWTCFTIRVPLMLSIIDGLLVKIRDDVYIIPTSGIEKIYPLITGAEEHTVFQVRVFEGRQIPYLDLREEFYPGSAHLTHQYLIAVSYKSQVFGLVVDDVVREYQAVVKPVGKLVQNGYLFMGASILGDGSVALVLDINSIIQKFSR